MTEAHSSYETDYTKPTIPVIKVNGEDVDTEGCVPFTRLPRGSDMSGYSLRNNYSPLCHQVVTACDSGRTLEESVQAYHEHQQVKIDELQVSPSE